jgi:hypothetical protein
MPNDTGMSFSRRRGNTTIPTLAEVEAEQRATLDRIQHEQFSTTVLPVVARDRAVCPDSCPIQTLGEIPVQRALEEMPIPRQCRAQDGYCRCYWAPVYTMEQLTEKLKGESRGNGRAEN